MSVPLVGQRVAVTVSEPWDFGTELGVGPHPGTIVADHRATEGHHAAVILQMDYRLVFQGSDYSLVRAAPRRESVGLDRLLAGERVFCSLVAVTPRDGDSVGESATGWVEDQTSGLIGTLEVLGSSSGRTA